MEEQREVLNSLQSVVSCLKHFPDVNNCGNLRGVPVITGNFRSPSVPSNRVTSPHDLPETTSLHWGHLKSITAGRRRPLEDRLSSRGSTHLIRSVLSPAVRFAVNPNVKPSTVAWALCVSNCCFSVDLVRDSECLEFGTFPAVSSVKVGQNPNWRTSHAKENLGQHP